MVGFKPDVKLSNTDHAAAGAISSSLSRAIGQPLDVLKIRFQLQVEPISRESGVSKYHSITQAVRSIITEEGYKALWKGHIPAQALSITYGISQYTIFEHLTKQAWKVLPEKFSQRFEPVTHTVCGSMAACVASVVVQPIDILRTRLYTIFEHLTKQAWKVLPEKFSQRFEPVTHTVCGSMAACVASVVVQPIDILRTRLVAQGEPKVYTSILHACRCVIKNEGIRGFYKGLHPTLWGVAPQMGIQFGLYSSLQIIWNRVFNLPDQLHPGTVESLVCGSGAGLLAKLIIYPMDVVKKRLQVQGFEEARSKFGAIREYSGLVNCVQCLVKEEGSKGLYKGLYPSLIKAAIISGSMFCFYDQICFVIVSLRSS